MKVKDLIEQLGYMDAEAEVHYSYNYGDHWRTRVAPQVSEVFEGAVKYSEYHRMDKMLDEEDTFDEDTGVYKKDLKRVVVIG
jgi:hypothetical protein